jgi:hypothetical protein
MRALTTSGSVWAIITQNSLYHVGTHDIWQCLGDHCSNVQHVLMLIEIVLGKND